MAQAMWLPLLILAIVVGRFVHHFAQERRRANLFTKHDLDGNQKLQLKEVIDLLSEQDANINKDIVESTAQYIDGQKDGLDSKELVQLIRALCVVVETGKLKDLGESLLEDLLFSASLTGSGADVFSFALLIGGSVYCLHCLWQVSASKKRECELIRENSRVSEENLQLNRHKSGLEQLRNELDEQNTWLSEVNDQLNLEKSDLEWKRDELHAENVRVCEENVRVSEQNTQLNQQKSELQEEIANLTLKKTKAMVMNFSLSAKAARAAKLEKDSQKREIELKQQCSSLEDESVQLNQQNTTLNQRNSELLIRSWLLTKMGAKMDKHKSELERKSSLLAEENDHLSQQRCELKKKSTELEQIVKVIRPWTRIGHTIKDINVDGLRNLVRGGTPAHTELPCEYQPEFTSGEQHFKITHLMGSGMHGAYLCREEGTPNQFVSKIYKHDDPELKKELMLVRKQVAHPNLMMFDKVVLTDRLLFVMMPRLAGEDLIDAAGRGLTEDAFKPFFWQVCKALACLHSHRITHGDIKMENVRLSRELSREGPTVKATLMDFGMSTYYKKEFGWCDLVVQRMGEDILRLGLLFASTLMRHNLEEQRRDCRREGRPINSDIISSFRQYERLSSNAKQLIQWLVDGPRPWIQQVFQVSWFQGAP